MAAAAHPAAIVEILGAPKLVSGPPLLSERPRLWFGFFEEGDCEVDTGGEDASSIVFQLSVGSTIERRVGKQSTTMDSALGLSTVTDPEIAAQYRVSGRARTLYCWLPHSELRAATGNDRPPAVTGRFCEKDRELQRCAQWALVALHDGEVFNPLLLSSLSLQISTHLLTRSPEGSARKSGGLSPYQARRIREFLQVRTGGTVGASPTLDQLAAEANLSLYHFSRQFRSTFGISPYAYSLNLRLERARNLLAQTMMPVAEVARQTGFASPAHFGERFRREMGATPGAIRRALQH